MYKLTIFFAIVAVAKAGYLHGNNQGAIVEDSYTAPLGLASLSYPAPVYGPPLRSAAPISYGSPSSIALSTSSYSNPIVRTPSYSAPIIRTPSYASPVYRTSSYASPIVRSLSYNAPAQVGLPAPVYGPPAPILRPSLAAPAPIYGAPAALPINSGLNSW